MSIVCLFLVLTVQQKHDSPSGMRITVSEAERRIAVWVGKYKTPFARHSHPKLKDVTPEDGWHRAGGQVFKQTEYTESIDETDAYFIRGREIVPLSIGFGGNGLISVCVADLNLDGKRQLVFTYSWGSGLHRSHLGIVDFEQPKPRKNEAEFVFRTYDIRLRKQGDQSVDAFAGNTALGKVVLINTPRGEIPTIKWDPRLPKAMKKCVWRMPSK